MADAVDPHLRPAMPPPEGIYPDFDAASELTPNLIATMAFCLPLTALALLVRLTTSLGSAQRRLRVEDYCCILASGSLVAICAITILAVQRGLGRHQWDVRASDIASVLQLLFVGQVLYSPTILAAKVTVLLQLQRIFVPPQLRGGAMQRLLQVVIALNACFYFSYFLTSIFQCAPVNRTWEKTIPGSCIKTYVNVLVTGAINIVSDLVILAFPMWAIWHLRLAVEKKLRTSAIFATGFLATVACAMRIPYNVMLLSSSDVTFWYLQLRLWAIAEIALIITCASLPRVPQFISIIRRALGLPSLDSLPHSARKISVGDSSLAWSKRHSRPSAATITFGGVEIRSADPVMFATTTFGGRPDEEAVASRKESTADACPITLPKAAVAHDKEFEGAALRTIESRITEVESSKEVGV